MRREDFIFIIIWIGLITFVIGGVLLIFGLLSMLFSYLLPILKYSPKAISIWGTIVLFGGILVAGIAYYFGEQYYYRG